MASKKGTELSGFMSLSEGGLFKSSCCTREFSTSTFRGPNDLHTSFSIGTKNRNVPLSFYLLAIFVKVCVCPHALQDKDSTQQISGWIETASYLVEGKALASGVQNGLQHVYFCQRLSASMHMH